MRTVGLITEYNPFHNGHLHHLRESLLVADADVAVAVMSGHFMQRGVPALVDKWVRAEMALKVGVDVVVELPFPWACNSAPYFAIGAVQALNAFGTVDALCFGSEAGTLAPLRRCADLLVEQGTLVENETAALLREGITFPAARARVFAKLTGDAKAAEVLAEPNNILGIAYLNALRQTESRMTPLTIQRVGSGYHDTEPGPGGIASATALRKMVGSGRAIADYIPPAALPALSWAISKGACLDEEQLHRLLLARIFRGAPSLRPLYMVDDGIENRLAEAANSSTSFESLVSEVKSRQLTRTRVQRILCYLLNEMSRVEMDAFQASGPLYLHLLAASPRGREFLAASRKSLDLPLISNYSRIVPALKRFYGMGTDSFQLARLMLELELRASRNYTLLMRNWRGLNRNRDYFEAVIG